MRVSRAVVVALAVLAAACDGPPGPDPVIPEPPPRVPDVVGYYRTSALTSLRDDGFVPVVKRRWTTSVRDGEVIRQRPVGGTSLEPGAQVVIVVARALLEVPDVHGFKLERARRVLRRRGFRVRVVEGSGGILGGIVEAGRVIRTRPGEFATRRPGSVITVVVKRAPPPPVDSECHSAYFGCVPIASDVDCAGGTGDGPAYVAGPVYLKGSYDPYGLDGYDNDGVGCE